MFRYIAVSLVSGKTYKHTYVQSCRLYVHCMYRHVHQYMYIVVMLFTTYFSLLFLPSLPPSLHPSLPLLSSSYSFSLLDTCWAPSCLVHWLAGIRVGILQTQPLVRTARTYARTYTRTRARTHARKHTTPHTPGMYVYTCSCLIQSRYVWYLSSQAGSLPTTKHYMLLQTSALVCAKKNTSRQNARVCVFSLLSMKGRNWSNSCYNFPTTLPRRLRYGEEGTVPLMIQGIMNQTNIPPEVYRLLVSLFWSLTAVPILLYLNSGIHVAMEMAQKLARLRLRERAACRLGIAAPIAHTLVSKQIRKYVDDNERE